MDASSCLWYNRNYKREVSQLFYIYNILINIGVHIYPFARGRYVLLSFVVASGSDKCVLSSVHLYISFLLQILCRLGQTDRQLHIHIRFGGVRNENIDY